MAQQHPIRLIAFLLLWLVSLASHSQVPTGLVYIEGARSSMSSVLSQARSEGQTLLADAAIHANGMIDRLEQILGKQISLPISQLSATLQNEIAATRFIVDAVRQTADQLPKCIGNEVDIALAGLKSGVSSALTSLPVVDGDPYAYLIKQPSSRSPYVITREPKGPDVSLIMQGANLWQKGEICEISAVAKPFDRKLKEQPVTVKFSDREKIHLSMPAAIPDGEWLVEVTAKRRATFLRCVVPDTRVVSAAMRVTRPITATYVVAVTPSCAGFAECRKPFVGSCTEGGTRRDNNCLQVIPFEDPACEYVRVDSWSAGGRDGNITAPERSGNTIIIRATANRRGRLEGGTSRQWWSGVMIGRKPMDPILQSKVEIPLRQSVKRGSSVSFTVDWVKPADCQLHAWTLGGTGTFSDGTVVAAPDTTILDKFSGTVAQGGIKSTLNSLTKQGTVEFSGAGCL